MLPFNEADLNPKAAVVHELEICTAESTKPVKSIVSLTPSAAVLSVIAAGLLLLGRGRITLAISFTLFSLSGLLALFPFFALFNQLLVDFIYFAGSHVNLRAAHKVHASVPAWQDPAYISGVHLEF